MPRIRLNGGRRAATLVLVSACAISSACLSDSGITLPMFDASTTDPLSPAAPWLGDFEGAGEGVLGGSTVIVDAARLVIRLDADSVRTPSCPQCLTVTFDTLFALANVPPVVGVSLMAGYQTGDASRTLKLDRFSGGGGVDNILLVQLKIHPLGTSGVRSDMVYVLERR